MAPFLNVLGWGVAISAVFGGTAGSAFRDAPLLGATQGALAGAINAAIVIGAIFGAEILLPPTRVGRALERAPFLVTFAVKLLVYGAVIVLVVAGRPGARLAAGASAALFSPDLAKAIYAKIKAPTAQLMVTWLVFVGSWILVLQLGRLIGYRTLGDVVSGRYHRARTEERFFLFVDIADSTALAERVGAAAIHRILSEVFRVVSDPIDDHHGEVYQYVGDEIVITWTVAEGRDGARPLACFFAIEQALERSAPDFEREFGTMPRLRAALHAGPVLTGEVGGSRRAIVHHGDVMNTTSRIEHATRDLGRQFLASRDALQRLTGLDAFALEDLGLTRLRGRAAAVHVYAVTPKPSTNGRQAIQAGPAPSNNLAQPTASGATQAVRDVGAAMTVQLDHTIVPSRDRRAAAELLATILGVPWAESGAGPFCPVYVNDGLTLDFDQADGPFPVQHYCFRVSEVEFDGIVARLVGAGIKYRSTPHGPIDMQINTHHGGRLVYWNEPDGHVWEVLTLSYARRPRAEAERALMLGHEGRS